MGQGCLRLHGIGKQERVRGQSVCVHAEGNPHGYRSAQFVPVNKLTETAEIDRGPAGHHRSGILDGRNPLDSYPVRE